ncbi:unnamed protein product [Larinioides sclopetarius]|uniref:PiggyBac transposable element-derived protein domain-containing protein n=1 Tax=Larinioides sclopetarius TaxID=280406 RepID=A0AAV2AAA1_9ARAC
MSLGIVSVCNSVNTIKLFVLLNGLSLPEHVPYNPIDYYYLFFDEEIFSFIESKTNRYAESHFQNVELIPASRAPKWKNTDNQEVKQFIALLLLQESAKACGKWFWSKRPILYQLHFLEIL